MGLGHGFPREDLTRGLVFPQTEELRLDTEILQKVFKKEHFGPQADEINRCRGWNVHLLCATGQIIVLVVGHLQIGQRPLSRLMKALELLMYFLDLSPPDRNVFQDQHQSPHSFVAPSGFDQLQKKRQAELVSRAEE